MRNVEEGDPAWWSTYDARIYAEVYRTFLITHVPGDASGKIGLLLIFGERGNQQNLKSRRKQKAKGNVAMALNIAYLFIYLCVPFFAVTELHT